jgi:predicted phosphodiesterase
VGTYGETADLTLDGKKIAIIHGDHPSRFNAILKAQEHDYLCCGHSHIRRDERVGKTRIINPGALHRATEKTVALLDTLSDKLEFIRIA